MVYIYRLRAHTHTHTHTHTLIVYIAVISTVQPVTHYTMAILMSALSDYNSSIIHLKFALSIDPKMSEAREFLQALKCLQIFEKEEYAIKKEVCACVCVCVHACVHVCVCGVLGWWVQMCPCVSVLDVIASL